MTKNKQTQKAGDGSNNYQIGTINQGLSYEDVRQISLDIYKANSVELSKKAEEIALKRVEEFIESFLSELQLKHPQGIQTIEDPDVLCDILAAEKAYARTGDSDLSEILVKLLIERTKITNRSILQIILNESLEVVSKLTNEQINFLSLIFIIKYTGLFSKTHFHYCGTSLGVFNYYMEKNLGIFLAQNLEEISIPRHLQYTNCVIGAEDFYSLESEIIENHPDLFSRGIHRSRLDEFISRHSFDESKIPDDLFIPCFHKINNGIEVFFGDENSKIQINPRYNDPYLSGFDKNCISLIEYIREDFCFEPSEVKKYLMQSNEFMNLMFLSFEKSNIGHFLLTDVGIAIAVANVSRKTDFSFDLSMWIK